MRKRAWRYSGPPGLLKKEILWHLSDATRPTSQGMHGYDLARRIAAGEARRALGHGAALLGRPRGDLRSSGVIYNALRDLESCGAVESEWEDPATALAARRPRRRYYRLTEDGWERARMLEQAIRLQLRLVAAGGWPWSPREFAMPGTTPKLGPETTVGAAASGTLAEVRDDSAASACGGRRPFPPGAPGF